MARAITSGELASLRADGQWSELYLAIHAPATVYSARVNQTFTSYDMVTQLSYDTGSGTLADVLPGMSLYVGSSAGAYDKGVVRIRKAPTGSVFYIGETSDIAFADNDYLTVVDDFDLWARHPVVDASDVQFMDNDVAYTDQHTNCDPVPVLGPDAVLWLTGDTVDFEPDAGESWVIGSTISAFLWTATGADSTADLDSATPTITYNAAGVYRVSCTVTAANGKSATGYRSVFVFDDEHMPATAFRLDRCEGNFDSGGWSFDVSMFAEADLSSVRDRAKVILFSRDYYNNLPESLGPVAGYENVIAAGRILGESIEWDADDGSVTFKAAGPQAWLNMIPGFPVGLKDTAETPSTWLYFNTLTVDKASWHFLQWCSTATLCLDIYPSGDTRRASALEGPISSLWQQLEALAAESILASPVCDRYGRLYIGIDPQYIPIASRGSIPVVMTLTEQDWQDRVDIDRLTDRPVAMVELSGTAFDGTSATPLFARAPGRVFKRLGSIETRDRLLLSDQSDANALAGLILGQHNNLFPRLSFDLAQNNRFIDIAPAQYCAVDIAAEDTLRGFVCSNKRLIPRVVTLEQNSDSGALTTSVDFEGENTQETAITIVREPPFTTNESPQPDTDLPPFPNFPPPYVPPGGWPPSIPPEPQIDPLCRTTLTWPANGPYQLSWPGGGGALSSLDPNPPYFAFASFMRSGSATYKTTIEISGYFETWDGSDWVPSLTSDWITVTAWDGNGLAATADNEEPSDDGHGTRRFVFSPVAGQNVTSYRIVLEGGAGDPPIAITWDGTSVTGEFHDGHEAREDEWDEWTWDANSWSGTGLWKVPQAIWNNFRRRIVLNTPLTPGVKALTIQTWWYDTMPQVEYVCSGNGRAMNTTSEGTITRVGNVLENETTVTVDLSGNIELGYASNFEGRWCSTPPGGAIVTWGFRILSLDGNSIPYESKRIRVENIRLYNICGV